MRNCNRITQMTIETTCAWIERHSNAEEHKRRGTTLRFLATGRLHEYLKFSTGISTYLSIPKTCKAIFEVMKEENM
ncbi:hypothetical protein J437_LFUL010409, partial [Ladona fulva]